MKKMFLALIAIFSISGLHAADGQDITQTQEIQQVKKEEQAVKTAVVVLGSGFLWGFFAKFLDGEITPEYKVGYIGSLAAIAYVLYGSNLTVNEMLRGFGSLGGYAAGIQLLRPVR